MYKNIDICERDLVNLKPVIKRLLEYEAILNSKYPDMGLEKKGFLGMPIKIEPALAEEMGNMMAQGSEENSHWIHLNSGDFYRLGEEAITEMIKSKKIADEEGTEYLNLLPSIASNVINRKFGQDVWCHKKTEDRKMSYEPIGKEMQIIIENLAGIKKTMPQDIIFGEDKLALRIARALGYNDISYEGLEPYDLDFRITPERFAKTADIEARVVTGNRIDYKETPLFKEIPGLAALAGGIHFGEDVESFFSVLGEGRPIRFSVREKIGAYSTRTIKRNREGM